MKSFFQFLSEASQSQAAMQAHKLGLISDGHGGWKNKSGEYVAKTEKGKLKFYNQQQKIGEKDPDQVRTPANQQVAATQTKPQPATSPDIRQKPSTSQVKKSKKSKDTLTVVFGRFNPPTIGHEKLLKTADKVSVGGDLKIYPSRTQDAKKNPLLPDTKISYMRKMFPDFGERIINDPYMKTIFDVLVAANQEGYRNVNIVVGSDRQAEFDNLAQKYNGDLYTFDLINVVSAGVRDADSEGVEGMSASKMRKAVMDNDFATFRRGTPKTLDDGDTQTLFDAIRRGMEVKKSKIEKESYSLWEIAPKFDQETLRENYIRGNIFKIGDIVENLNTGLVGKIIRRGTNYLICVTEQDNMFKSWIKDVMEYAEVKMNNMHRLPGKPNTLTGTTGYLKYAVKQTPESTLGKENVQKGGRTFLDFINKYRKK
jgi:hypothetical protein